MKKTVELIILCVILLIAVIGGTSLYEPCAKPITYTIGSIDDRFSLSESDVIADLEEASSIWGTHERVPLFTYDKSAKLTINLVYDERQALTQQLNKLDSELHDAEESLKPQIEEFERRKASYNARVGKLNEEVTYWNSQGGAPKDVFDRLTSEQQDLRNEGNDLEKMANDLNSKASSLNLSVQQFNETAENFNELVGEEPEQGLYDGKSNTIYIYFMRDEEELIHTLAHELGHARGIAHTSDKENIMYAYSNQVTSLGEEDKKLLSEVCRKRMYFQLVKERFMIMMDLISERMRKS